MIILVNRILFFNYRLLFAICLAGNLSLQITAQQDSVNPVHPKELNTIIDSISTIVQRYYIDPEVGSKIVNHIKRNHKNGRYKEISDPGKLADSLKKDLRAVNADLHMSMIYRDPRQISTQQHTAIQVNESGLWSNYGLSEIKVLEGNIGYLKIKHFTQHQFFEVIKPHVRSAFEFLKKSDAIIIDVRNNGGGFEDMVAHYISYLFDGQTPIHLSDYRCTLHNHIYGISTDPNIPGPKLPNTKLYVLVNAMTGSAAESFAYMLKHLNRATIIGEITVGAGNGASQHKINNRFSVQVSTEETINAVTKTSFEKVGVIPHIKTTSQQSYNEAYRLALVYAKEKNTKAIDASNYDNLISFIPSKKTGSSENYTKYVGNYKDGTIHITVTLENNTLYAHMVSKGGRQELTQLKHHIFKVGELKERIQFIHNDKGEVIQLIGLDTPMELTKVD